MTPTPDPPTKSIAGHMFAETTSGRICVAVDDVTKNRCGRRWVDIRGATLADKDKPHIAHIGNATLVELDQIIAEAAREDAVTTLATRIAAGFGVGGMLPGSEQQHQEEFL